MKEKKIHAVYSSPLLRSRTTAEIAIGNIAINTDIRLMEVDFGAWESKSREELIIDDASVWEAWNHDPENTRAGGNGETGRQVIERVDDFYNDMLCKHANQTILIVGHNGINRHYIAFKLGMSLKNYRKIFQENASITFFELDDTGEIVLKKLNS